MGKIYFLSHSSDDTDIVTKVADELGKDQCWSYEWEVKPGDEIFEFDKGIADSRVFVLFWSGSASRSPFVRDEVSQARIRLTRDRGFRLVVVRLDKTPLPAALESRFWIKTMPVQQIVEQLRRVEYELTPKETFIGQLALKEVFQNREKELDILEGIALSGNDPIMILGLDGIGKTSFVKSSILTILSHLTPIWVDLEAASMPVRLLSAIAAPLSIIIDTHRVAENPVNVWRSVLLPEIVASDRLLIIIDNLRSSSVASRNLSERVLELVEIICEDLTNVKKPNNPGLIAISWIEPNFQTKTLKKFYRLPIGTLQRKSIVRVLRYQLNQLSPLNYDLGELEKIAEYASGYPGAIGALSQKIAQDGTSAALEDADGLKRIRRNFADDIIRGIKLNREEKDLLILLSTTAYQLSKKHIRALNIDIDTLESIKRKQLLDPSSSGSSLHSILRDYISESLANGKEIIDAHGKLAGLFGKEWENAIPLSASKAYFASLYHYHLLSSGSRRRAKMFAEDFTEEAKAAGIELYRRGQYEDALNYLIALRKMNVKADQTSDFYYALALNRMNKHKEALDIIYTLTKEFPWVSRYWNASGTILRSIGEDEEALESFKKAVGLATKRAKVTPLCAMADLLSSKGRSKEAVVLVEEALDIEPNKAYVVAVASKIYDEIGEPTKALRTILDGIRIAPEDSRLHHRAGIILKQLGRQSEAKAHLERASMDPALAFSVTALADVYLELGDMKKAEDTVEKFPGNKERSASYLSTKGNILRKKEDYDGAEILLFKAIKVQPKDVLSYGILVQIEYEKALKQYKQGDISSALKNLDNAYQHLEKGFEIESKNERLLALKYDIGNLRMRIHTQEEE